MKKRQTLSRFTDTPSRDHQMPDSYKVMQNTIVEIHIILLCSAAKNDARI